MSKGCIDGVRLEGKRVGIAFPELDAPGRRCLLDIPFLARCVEHGSGAIDSDDMKSEAREFKRENACPCSDIRDFLIGCDERGHRARAQELVA